MAIRRMISKEVLERDDFYILSQMAKLYYLYLCVYADDDGFYAAPMKLLESLKCPYSVIKELIEGGFIIIKEDGVTIVKHWLWHNQIDPKKYTPSTYSRDDIGISDNGVYEFIDGTDPKQLSLPDLYARNPKNPGKPVTRDKIHMIKNNLLLDSSDSNTSNDVEIKIHMENENGHFSKLDTTDKNRLDKDRLGESIDVSLKYDSFDESQIEYSDDFLYGTCHNVNLVDSKLLEIYKTFVDAKELIDKVSLILENAKTNKRNHFAFVMKIGKEDHFLTWEQLDSIKINKKKKEAELVELEKELEKFSEIEEMERLGIENKEEYERHIEESRARGKEQIINALGYAPWENEK